MPKKKRRTTKKRDKPQLKGVEAVQVGLKEKQRSVEAQRGKFDQAHALMENTALRISEMQQMIAEQKADNAEMKKLHLPDAFTVMGELVHDLLMLIDELNPASPMSRSKASSVVAPSTTPPAQPAKPSKQSVNRKGDIGPIPRMVLGKALEQKERPTLEQAFKLVFGPSWEKKKTIGKKRSYADDLAAPDSQLRLSIGRSAKTLLAIDPQSPPTTPNLRNLNADMTNNHKTADDVIVLLQYWAIEMPK